MSRILSPLSDISNAWTLFGAAAAKDCIADDPDAADDDVSYISTGTDGAVCEVALDAVDHPNELGRHVMRVVRRVRNYDAGNQPTLTVDLVCATTVIATITDVTGGAAYALIEYDLSEAEKEAIIDYANLRLRFTDTLSPGTQQHRVTAARFVVPDRRLKVYSLD